MAPQPQPLVDLARPLTDWLVRDYGCGLTAEGDQRSSWGAIVELRSAEFIVTIQRDRGQEWIRVGATERPGPRKPRRSSSLGHLVAFLDGEPDAYGIFGLDVEMGWLRDRRDEILNVATLNSEELRRWKVRASRRLFGQEPRG